MQEIWEVAVLFSEKNRKKIKQCVFFLVCDFFVYVRKKYFFFNAVQLRKKILWRSILYSIFFLSIIIFFFFISPHTK
jgi:hypothetical protein